MKYVTTNQMTSRAVVSRMLYCQYACFWASLRSAMFDLPDQGGTSSSAGHRAYPPPVSYSPSTAGASWQGGTSSRKTRSPLGTSHLWLGEFASSSWYGSPLALADPGRRHKGGALRFHGGDGLAVLDVLDERTEWGSARAPRVRSLRQSRHGRFACCAVQIALEDGLTAQSQPLDLADGQPSPLEAALIVIDKDLLSTVQSDLAVGPCLGIADEAANLPHGAVSRPVYTSWPSPYRSLSGASRVGSASVVESPSADSIFMVNTLCTGPGLP